MAHRTLSRLFAVAAFVVSLAAATPARAATIQLGFILDSSGSIGAGNWGILTNGLATALTTHIPLGGPNTYEISVVTFSDSDTDRRQSRTDQQRRHANRRCEPYQRRPVPGGHYELRGGIHGHAGCADEFAEFFRRRPFLRELCGRLVRQICRTQTHSSPGSMRGTP